MNSRILSTAIRSSECAVRIARRGLSVQQRTFSSFLMRQKHVGVPTFTEVSSPKLQDLLTKIRERIFLVDHVSKAQRDLIFDPQHKKSLEVDPVTVTIAGEDFTLKHLDPVVDIPERRKTLRDAVALMKEKRDWDNLPNLLQGLKTAGFRIKEYESMSLIRRAERAGRHDVVLECLRRADETGITLTSVSIVVKVFLSMAGKAIASDWDAEETKKALHWAEMVREMMEDPKHQTPTGNKIYAEIPDVASTLLELAAVRAVKHHNGKDVDGKVEKYALDLLPIPRNFSIDEKTPSTFKNYWLISNIRMVHAIKLAQTLLDPTSELSTELKKISVALEPLLLSTRDELSEVRTKRGETLMGVKLYEKLLSHGAS